MRYRLNKDPFESKQPIASFVDDLKEPIHIHPFSFWNERDAAENEIFLSSVNIITDFPDENGLLDSAYSDFRKFLRISNIAEDKDGVRLCVLKAPIEYREEYEIEVTSEKITVSAGDSEGVRRALIYLEDEMQRRSGSFLPIGVIHRKPFVKNRISRCFFSPPSHASNKGKVNELLSDIDYYPEEYLNRLAHDGVNGLWIGASLRDLVPSKVIKGYGENSERMLAKLNAITQRCKKYGIGVYILSVEPASGYCNPLFETHSELHGQKGWADYHLFCPSTEGCEEYIKESVTGLFRSVPELRGFINISTGECLSGCGSAAELTCPACKRKFGTLAKALAATEKMFADALAAASPDAEFISWTYSQRVWDENDVIEACQLRDTSVVHMQNFEDKGKVMQLGRERLALDYWLSYVGPGQVMSSSLNVNRRRGVRTYAKIQACSSHEITSVPYVPVPGILYDKFKAMHENGIDGTVMCWYFGNYPCLMSKAACEASFEPFFASKSEFISHLAGIYWGEDASAAREAFIKFEEGYRNYPVSQSFEWFGPMQDSPAVPLHLIPVDLPMPSTWLTENMVGGDRIGECLTDGHTIEEAVELTEAMSRLWDEGTKILSSIPSGNEYARIEQKRVAEAISVLFESGNSVLRFYRLRRILGIGSPDPLGTLNEMKKIVLSEIDASHRLAELCKEDSRLGYHSEAHGYKFFPEKLNWRISELEGLLHDEFSAVASRINNGLPPIAFYAGECDCRVIRTGEAVELIPSDSSDKSNTVLKVYESEGRIYLSFLMNDGEQDSLIVNPEYRMFYPSAPFTLSNGSISMPDLNNYSFFGEFAEKRRKAISCRYSVNTDESIEYLVSFARHDLGMEENEPFRLDVRRIGRHNEVLATADRMYDRLIFGNYSPDSYAMIVK